MRYIRGEITVVSNFESESEAMKHEDLKVARKDHESLQN